MKRGVTDAPGMALTVAALTFKEGELTLDQALEPDSGITGTVVNAEGQPVQGAMVCLSTRSFSLNNGAMRPLVDAAGTGRYMGVSSQWMGKPQTDEKGGFSGRMVNTHPASDDRLMVVHPTEGFQHVLLKDWKKGGTMKLERWSTLHGKVTDADGNPMKGSAVAFYDTRLFRDDSGRTVFSLSDTSTVTTDNEGRYKADRILPQANIPSVSVDGQFRNLVRLSLKSGETQEFNIRLPAKEAVVPGEQLRKMTGRVVAPEGTPLRNDDYDVVVSVAREGGGKTDVLYLDAQGRFESKPSAPGNYTIRVTKMPKDRRKVAQMGAGVVSMRVKLEPDATQQARDLGDFPLKATDLVLRPASGLSTSYSRQSLNAVSAGSVKFATWAGSGGRGLAKEEPAAADGRITGETPVDPLRQFIIRGTTADGARYFSAAQTAGLEPGTLFEGAMTFTPAVAVEGRMLDLPADYAGGGWVVATVMVSREVKPETVLEGTILTMPWSAWAPLERDGRFRFAALPRGSLTLAGFANGWITRDALNNGTAISVVTAGSDAVVKANLDARPSETKRLRLLRPDDAPAAGATITVASDWAFNSPAFVRRGHDVESAHTEAYARFKEANIPGHSATADADGYVTLSNQPTGPATYRVQWTDPQTKAVYRERVGNAGLRGVQDPWVIKLAGKNE
jgi:hypothetical protein